MLMKEADMDTALALALTRRLSRLPARCDEDYARSPAAADAGPEEEVALRLCMVRYWPKFRAGHVGQNDVVEYLLHLEKIFSAAKTDDLRFLDAWNNAYEVLFQDEVLWLSRDQARRFSEMYADLLRMHIDKLNARTDVV